MISSIVIIVLLTIASIIGLYIFRRRHYVNKAVIGGISAIVASCIISSFAVVPAGHVGIVDLWGNVKPTALKAGIHIINPLANVISMSIKTHEMKAKLSAPSKEGLMTTLEVSLWYKINPADAPTIYKTIGTDYASVIIVPTLRSVARATTARYETKALYTTGRDKLVTDMFDMADPITQPKGVIIDRFLLRRVSLPPTVSKAIERKLQAEQEADQMEFVLAKEKQEAERKRVEAQGIADFQRIVTKGITPSLLKWKGIEATEALASSENTKIVVIGNSADGLPLILGGK